MSDMEQILIDIKSWAIEAGEYQIKALEQPLQVRVKSADIDLVTEIDEWTENFLTNKIKEKYPDHAILSEESGKYTRDSDYEWIIDPIDGTTNFVHHFPMFCISIAVKYKGETIIGVVYAPKLNEMYEAIRGKGALLNGKPIHVSSVKEMTKSIIATGFPYDRATDPINNVDQFNKIVLKVGGIRRTGSAAIDLCQVAAGRFEGYWEYKINPWDFEAGLLLIKEAGGLTLTIRQDKGYFVLVGNQYIFNQLKDILNI